MCTEEIEYIKPTVLPKNAVVCEDFIAVSAPAHTYYVMPEGCTDEDVSEGCTEYIHQSCYSTEGDLGNSALCFETKNGIEDCVELSGNFGCETFSTYHGPTCTFRKGCEQTVEKIITYVDIGDPDDCHKVCDDADGTYIASDNENPSFGKPSIPINDVPKDCPAYIQADIECSLEEFSASIEDISCIKPGVVLTFEKTGDQVECDDVTAQVSGDYWCPSNFQYDSLAGYCIKTTEIISNTNNLV